MIPILSRKYDGFEMESVCDPSIKRSETDHDEDPLVVLSSRGIETVAATDQRGVISNAQQLRWDSVLWFLTQLVDGKAMFELSPECKLLRKGFNGAYKFRRMRIQTDDAEPHYSTVPDKNKFSHPHDGLQYLCMYLRSPMKSERKVITVETFKPMDNLIGY